MLIMNRLLCHSFTNCSTLDHPCALTYDLHFISYSRWGTSSDGKPNCTFWSYYSCAWKFQMPLDITQTMTFHPILICSSISTRPFHHTIKNQASSQAIATNSVQYRGKLPGTALIPLGLQNMHPTQDLPGLIPTTHKRCGQK